MMTTALIVCGDDIKEQNRTSSLASVLDSRFQVYCRGRDGKKWGDYKWANGRFSKCDPFPKDIDVLFFHTGGLDSDQIPSGVKFKVEFAFNSAKSLLAEGRARIGKRENVLKIIPPFRSDSCPVKEEDLEAIEALVEGPMSTEYPSFCLML